VNWSVIPDLSNQRVTLVRAISKNCDCETVDDDFVVQLGREV